MTRIQRSNEKLSTLWELLAFMWGRKRWWLLPVAIVLLLLAGLIVFAESSALAPLIYTVF
ncbi:MAG: DUF5989 family protein [Phycisphaerae bacterium]